MIKAQRCWLSSCSLQQVSALAGGAEGLRCQRWLLPFATPTYFPVLCDFLWIKAFKYVWAPCRRADRPQQTCYRRYKVNCGVKVAHKKHPELKCLMRGCDALILQKEDKMNKSMVSFWSKCEILLYYIKVGHIQWPCVVIFIEKLI